VHCEETFKTKVGSDEVAIVPSALGPALSYNREMFPLTEPCWDIEMVLGRSYQLVTFYWRGEAKLSLRINGLEELILQLYKHLNSRNRKPLLV
jgi:hypothetical protein